MKRILSIVSLVTLPLVASADVGFGASFKSSEGGIYLPVSITPRLIVEPYLQYRDGDADFSVGDDTASSGESSFTTYTVGAGLFGVSDLGDSIDLYYGARAAYLSQESTSTALILSPAPIPGLSPPRSELDADGFSIAPTIGFQYFLNDRLSLGAEARWEFVELSGTITSTTSSGTESRIDQTTRDNETRTDVILRVYFR